jgi:hypothetical protein
MASSGTPDSNKWLWQLGRKLIRLTSGRSGTPQQTRLARVAVLVLGLICVVPRLLDALGSAVWVILGFIGLVVALRLVVRWWRRRW